MMRFCNPKPIISWLTPLGEDFITAINLDVDLSISSIELLNEIISVGKSINKVPRVHIEIDTGMNRGGFGDEWVSLLPEIVRAVKTNEIKAIGIWSHFARADEPNEVMNKTQLDVFEEKVKQLNDAGVNLELIHIANSAAGATWATLTGVSTTAARLLKGDDANYKVRLVPAANFNGTATLTYLAWDQTSGTAGATAEVTTAGGSTAFSSTSAAATITVTAVNDAPTLALGKKLLRSGADALVIVTDWNEYRFPDFARVKAALRTPVVVDGPDLEQMTDAVIRETMRHYHAAVDWGVDGRGHDHRRAPGARAPVAWRNRHRRGRRTPA